MAFTVTAPAKTLGPAISQKQTYVGGDLFAYNGGSAIVPSGNDAVFQTLVIPVPEPATISLSFLSCGFLLRRRRSYDRSFRLDSEVTMAW